MSHYQAMCIRSCGPWEHIAYLDLSKSPYTGHPMVKILKAHMNKHTLIMLWTFYLSTNNICSIEFGNWSHWIPFICWLVMEKHGQSSPSYLAENTVTPNWLHARWISSALDESYRGSLWQIKPILLCLPLASYGHHVIKLLTVDHCVL